MLYVYIGCLTFGAIYSILSLVLGSHGYDHGNIDHGNINHGDMPSPFNPLVIASAITTFGAAGLIAKIGFQMGNLVSSLLALGLAGVVGAILFFCVVRFMYGSQSDSTFSKNDLSGVEAEVLTPVPQKGLGEVVCFINGERYSLPARNPYGEEINRGEKVIVIRVDENVAMVTRKMAIDDLDLQYNKNTGIKDSERNSESS
ncbi:MAG: NfeD family protein [Clostridia bacterium]|nr:NfeD family protein [Clostridia bacterium]